MTGIHRAEARLDAISEEAEAALRRQRLALKDRIVVALEKGDRNGMATVVVTLAHARFWKGGDAILPGKEARADGRQLQRADWSWRAPNDVLSGRSTSWATRTRRAA